MYVVLLTYTAPLQEIDYALPDHVEWLAKQYEHEYLLASGRREAHLGEVLLARPMPRGKLDAVLASDPLALANLAHHEVIDFVVTRTAAQLRELNESITH
ncbi:hypothetical protein SacmaDRAFT_4402 [Saccharomonospora marina XMU15]|uniref:YCII-related domain-containing protein n=1 Tax=Saccharomonospora marina XMU15 TaxID=882083 RepID=H5X9V0_9PSEU|nr:hypothetical protein [Saccharomonospora marina]EHR52588.1 hypothetical protein SacmaDRAFT_4402 [Saccharomonospora marina XMU15]